ncbi:MAG: hypothetical protein IKW14_06815 [Phascolarctobacterium sp.]|nr:hypothetical protein [Phascolarctobacterium sp.]
MSNECTIKTNVYRVGKFSSGKNILFCVRSIVNITKSNAFFGYLNRRTTTSTF